MILLSVINTYVYICLILCFCELECISVTSNYIEFVESVTCYIRLKFVNSDVSHAFCTILTLILLMSCSINAGWCLGYHQRELYSSS